MVHQKTLLTWLVACLSLWAADSPAVSRENTTPAYSKAKAALVPGAVNVALGKKYFLFPAPNYKLCTGPSDTTDLTDGKRAHGNLWLDQATVGWGSPQAAISITIDLGEPHVVNRLRYCTGGGCAGVVFPSQLDYEASLDGMIFYRIGDLAQDTPKQPPEAGLGYRAFAYDVYYPPVNVRYVRIHALPKEKFFFSDEIEVYSAPQEKPVPLTQFPVVEGDMDFILNQGSRVIRQSFLRLLSAATAGKDEPTLKSRISSWRLSCKPEKLDGAYPFDPLQEDIFAYNAAQWRQSGASDCVFWTDDFYAPVHPERLAPKYQSDSQKVVLRETMMSGARRGLVLNIANASKEPIPLQARLNGVKGEILRVIYLDTKKGEPSSTLLAPLCDKTGRPDSKCRVIPGMVVQLVVLPETQDLQPGVNHSTLIVTLGKQQHQFPLELNILPIAFPEQPSLKTGGFDYLDEIANGKEHNWLGWQASYATDALKKIREMHFQIRCASSGCFAASRPERLKYSDEGALISKPDFTGFDRWVAANPKARFFHVFCGLDNVTYLDRRIKPGTPQFNRAITEWAHEWNNHILGNGLQGRVIFQLLKEPWDLSKYIQEEYWNKPFQKGAPDIPTLTDPTLTFQPEWTRYIAYSSILCPATELLQGEQGSRNLKVFQKVLAANGGELWCYSGRFSIFTAPPAALRNQGWIAARAGAVGFLFWGVTSPMPNICNMYSATWEARHHSPFWLMEDGRMGITKHYCALRDSIQDYELLKQFQERLDKATRQGRNVTRAKDRLNRLLNTVSEETFPLFDVLRDSQGTKARQELLRLYQSVFPDGLAK